ncbi:ATPase [Subtercola boreus]|uniref:ATPase n=1 Tax=Subtercola boreus TaxID=120213 RepID=A0A3E0VMV5_9MICO|nr:AAA family ATPase [Subtercola boreus]RFA10753.1 ATPase [Subtercola boreus]TQL55677.1 putative ABC-type ATPase [Subtercola boreus]
MSSPVLHVLAGPNGAGKSTFVRAVLQPVTHLPFINADEIAAERWPGSEAQHAYDASAAASIERERAFAGRHSFITETVFSHPSKLELVRLGAATGYLVALHVILVPEDVTVRRVAHRVTRGGHTVPEAKIRERYRRLWGLVAEARSLAHSTTVYDNSRATDPFEVDARYERGRLIGSAAWPSWTPPALTS